MTPTIIDNRRQFTVDTVRKLIYKRLYLKKKISGAEDIELGTRFDAGNGVITDQTVLLEVTLPCRRQESAYPRDTPHGVVYTYRYNNWFDLEDVLEYFELNKGLTC